MYHSLPRHHISFLLHKNHILPGQFQKASLPARKKKEDKCHPGSPNAIQGWSVPGETVLGSIQKNKYKRESSQINPVYSLPESLQGYESVKISFLLSFSLSGKQYHKYGRPHTHQKKIGSGSQTYGDHTARSPIWQSLS